MKAFTQWVSTVMLDAILVVSAYYWLIGKVDGAGNLFMFIVWFFTAIGLVNGFTLDRTWFEKNPAAPGIRAINFIVCLLIIGILAWIGYFWTAGLYAFSNVLYEVARKREPKAKAAQ